MAEKHKIGFSETWLHGSKTAEQKINLLFPRRHNSDFIKRLAVQPGVARHLRFAQLCRFTPVAPLSLLASRPSRSLKPRWPH